MRHYIDIINEELLEARRNPELNQKASSIDILSKYVNQKDIFISFTDIDKLGINPQTPHSEASPNGIYGYPLSDVLPNMIKAGTVKAVPYAGERPYIWIFKPKSGVKITNFDNISIQEVTRAHEYGRKLVADKLPSMSNVQKGSFAPDPAEEQDIYWLVKSKYNIPNSEIESFINALPPQEMQTLYDEAGITHVYDDWIKNSLQLFGKLSNGERLFYQTRLISLALYGKFNIDEQFTENNSNAWNKILRNLGYQAFITRSGFTPNPTSEAVFLQKSYIDIIDKIQNR